MRVWAGGPRDVSDPTTTRSVTRFRGEPVVTDDVLVVEEPLEIRFDGTPLAVVMRTPGDDASLALGFALTEGIVTRPGAIDEVVELGEGRLDLVPAEGVRVDPAQFQRNFYSTSSCGVCGKASIDAIRVAGARPPDRSRGDLLRSSSACPRDSSSARPPSTPPVASTPPPPSPRLERSWRSPRTWGGTTRSTR